MNLQQAYYELRFEVAFRSAKGDEFQTFFERLMGLAYKADFMACRPWGLAASHCRADTGPGPLRNGG